MTTVTVVTGGKDTGKKLIATAITKEIIAREPEKKVLLVIDSSAVVSDEVVDDLIIVSSSGELEDWMEPWFEKYGAPLFYVNTIRTRPKDDGQRTSSPLNEATK
jgi:hypothetical protein